MYYCIIWSNNSYGRLYEVETKSAMKCASMFGRCEGGEVVSVCRQNGHILSRVVWSPENGGEYVRVTVDEGESFDPTDIKVYLA